jgi:hypothetical protein
MKDRGYASDGPPMCREIFLPNPSPPTHLSQLLPFLVVGSGDSIRKNPQR